MNSFSLYTVSGGQTLFNIGFEYLRAAYLRVSINDVLTSDWALAGSGTQVDISAAGAINGDEVKIYRVTPVADDDRLVQWLDGAFLNQENLDTHQLQLLHSIQELIENPGETGTIFGIPTGGTTSQVLTKLSDTDYDADWVDASGGGGGAVDSVFGRTGAVVAATSDYDASQVDNDASGFTATDVAGALEELLTQAGVSSVFGRTGDVVATAADYDGMEVTVGSWAGGSHDYVTDALNFLFASKDDGDVIGPGSSGTRNICTFADTTGKLIQDSAVEVTALRVIQNILALSVTNSSSATPVLAANSGGATFDIRCGSGTPAAEGLAGTLGALYVQCTPAAEGALWIFTSSGWVDLTAATGSGDVSGPGSGTDNAIARWDGTGGDTLQDSGITIDDDENIDGVNTISGTLQESAVSGGRTFLDLNFTDPADGTTARTARLYIGTEDPNQNFDPSGAASAGSVGGDIFWKIDEDGLGSNDTSALYLCTRGDDWKRLLATNVATTPGHYYADLKNSDDNTTQPDTNEVMRMESTGTNGDTCRVYVGTQDPNGVVTGTDGALYIRCAGSASALYVNTSSSFSTTWTELGAATGTFVDSVATSASLGEVALFSDDDTITNLTYVNQKLIHEASNGQDGLAAGYFKADSTAADTVPVLDLQNSGTNGGDADVYVGNRDPDSNVTGTLGDLYLNDTGGTLHVNKGGNDWSEVVDKESVRVNRAYAAITHGAGTTTLNSTTLTRLDYDDTTATLANGFVATELDGATTGFDALTWSPADGRTATFSLVYKMTIKTTSSAEMEARIIPNINSGGTTLTNAILYCTTHSRNNSRQSATAATVITLTDGDTLEFPASLASGSSNNGVVDNYGFSATLIELSSDNE